MTNITISYHHCVPPQSLLYSLSYSLLKSLSLSVQLFYPVNVSLNLLYHSLFPTSHPLLLMPGMCNPPLS